MSIKLINTAMLNLRLIKNGSFSLKNSHVSSPIRILRGIVNLFQSNIRQLGLTVEIREKIFGDLDAVLAFEKLGIELDVDLYR